jgi:glycosyltransferase involved in cell wall biosynthesis
MEPPLVSIVTPSYNARRFIEETIQSVLAQDYSNIEYIVMDGGSNDGTTEVLQRHRDRLQYKSQPDLGPADAIRRGFELSRGSILAWLSADDTYLPGAISAAVEALGRAPGAGVVYGDAWWMDETGETTGRYPTRPFDRELLGKECFICQPAAFFRRDAYEEAGRMDAGLAICFDYELWIRMSRLRPMVKIDRLMAASRMHPGNLTLGRRRLVYSETCRVLAKHFGYVPFQWLYDYASYVIRNEAVYPAPFTLRAYLLSLVFGLRFNPRCLPRFLKEWGSAIFTASSRV